MSKIQLHKIEKGMSDKVLDIFVSIGAFSQVIIGIILIFQLDAYKQSNDLTRDSIDLSRKSVILSHTPWITVTRLLVAIQPPQASEIQFYVENHSDYPVFKMKSGQLLYEDSVKPSENAMIAPLEARASNDTIMPHDERHFDNVLVSSDSVQAINAFYSNRATLEIYIEYCDMFNRKIIFRNFIRSDPDNMKKNPIGYRVIDSRIDGLDNFSVKDL